MESLFDLTNEIAVVIGATGVLGGALAEGLAGAGAAVAVLGRSEERCKACVQRIEKAKGKARFFFCDAGDQGSLATAHREIPSVLGAPTILVTAAGGTNPKTVVTAEHPFGKLQLRDWRENFDLNLAAGALLPCQ